MKYICLILLFLLSCGGGEESRYFTGTRHEWSKEISQYWMDACTHTPEFYQWCRCALEDLQIKYTEEEFLNEDNHTPLDAHEDAWKPRYWFDIDPKCDDPEVLTGEI